MADKGLTFTPIAAGSFPDGYASRMQGGLHVVADTTERDAIPSYRRLTGMLVHVLADNTIYRLTSAPANAPTWAVVMPAPAASGDSGKVLTVSGATPTWATLNALPSGGASGKFLGYGAGGAEWQDGKLTPNVGVANSLFLSAANATPTTLAIGSEGQTLRVSAAGAPAWAYPQSKRMHLVIGSATNDTATYLVAGSLVFDKSLLDARTGQNISLRYLLETSSGANSAKLRLWNRTSNAIIGAEQTTTATSAATATTLNVNSALSALSGETIIEVQIALATDGSDGSAIATLKGAWIEAV